MPPAPFRIQVPDPVLADLRERLARARWPDQAPGAESPMHRTETLDVGVVLEGETWLLLDDGSETRVGPGDAVVQRGTNHAWANRSDRPVRMLFVLVDGTITDEVRAAAGPLELFDQVLD